MSASDQGRPQAGEGEVANTCGYRLLGLGRWVLVALRSGAVRP